MRGVSGQVSADKGRRDASRRVISKHFTYANPSLGLYPFMSKSRRWFMEV